ncbi:MULTISPECIES: SDR family NAD(P)-dependent oxidoreductase [Mycobacterium]|jgi:NAD(P)-dependent dehydrogenase (short-subunit alcohol dehydrogenase family)|uniref:SDR family NAD(P)-dependent oxidoreductase n=1 Tax=Mycobacterium TaxID=1763 RepID=UPI000F034DDE|nr:MULTISPECIES: SDR family NAD(P)-dependent oxidoreductase [Mycobacterium]TDK98164.1 SDR family NAD(P)-dependent oxidoreductase [Mycobacterium paragordonae]VAZ69690.1 3-oxoacyl-[acyl-carrier-protein] reductase FabG [Mycobacterium kansasii]
MTATSQVVLITGCSTGIGRATAARLAAAGHTVYATARRESSIKDLAEAGCRTMALDVTDEDSMRAAVDRVVAEHGAVEALVNNAGYSQSGAIETLSLADLRRQFETNVYGLVRMCQLVLPGMRERRTGRIVNVSSVGANFTFPGGGAYHASKYAVEAISDALRFEVQGFGVKVVIVQPGLIRTDFSATAIAAIGGDSVDSGPYAAFNAGVAQATKDVYEKGPLAPFGGDPDDVARAIQKAITARRPKLRMRVTPSAHLLKTQRRLMTDRMWDRFLKTQFTAPIASADRP